MLHSKNRGMITIHNISTLIVLLFILCHRCLANEVLRPQSFHDIGSDTTVEEAVRVEGAIVAWADLKAIRRDFPALRKRSDDQIKEWLLDNFAYMGSEQSKLDGIRNTKIPLDPKSKKRAFRPYGWDRSAVLEAHGPDGQVIGLVDIKGFGHGARTISKVESQVREYEWSKNTPAYLNKLRTRYHSDGLMSFGEGIAETYRQQGVQRLFEMSGLNLETVESYAIIMLPFDILKENGAKIPAALYIRQAHSGRESGSIVPANIYIDRAGGMQKTSRGSAVDFGGVMISDARLRSNFMTSDGGKDSRKANAWKSAHQTAKEFAMKKTPNLIQKHLDAILAPIQSAYETSATKRAYDRFSFARTDFINALAAKGLSSSEIEPLYKDWLHRQPFYNQNIENGLKTDDIDMKVEWIKTLHGRDDAESLAILERAKSYLGSLGAYALHGRTDTRSLDLIRRLLKSPEPSMRRYAAEALKGRKDEASLRMIAKLIKNPEENALVKRASFDALRGRPDKKSLALIQELLSSHDLAIRQATAEALVGRTDHASLPIIEALLNDPDLAVRRSAAAALEGRNDNLSLSVAERLILNPEEDAIVQRHAIKALDRRTDRKSLKIIGTLLESQDASVRMHAIKALAGRTDDASLELISKALKDSNPIVSETALEVFETRTDHSARALAQKFLGTKTDPQMRFRFMKIAHPRAGCGPLHQVVSNVLRSL